jgi:hypothetical protein
MLGFSMAAFRISNEKVPTMYGRVRGRTKDECWRNYIADQAVRGTIPLDVVPRNKQEAYEAMEKDNETGIWTLDFAFANSRQIDGVAAPRHR